MSNKLLKPKKASLCEFTQNYSNNINNCIELFKSIEWPDGFSYDHCGYHKYYLVKRIGINDQAKSELLISHAIIINKITHLISMF
ncbi:MULTISPECIES: hypothetical protein [Catenibacterium]|uniref:Uncharacterized protein n=2 Tax=Catenibacterium faecis TaxID=2764323 RepID=A0ABR7KE94_9FIRM|nr:MULTISPECIES: hypothetical protein [Catenibacterium]MBC6011047.1 hypothetical protein [Catenibacterium faecis]